MCLIILFGGISVLFPNASSQFIVIDNTNQATGVYTPIGCGHIEPKPTCVFPVHLDADADAPYWQWSTGETTQSISVTSVGTYTWQTADLSKDVVKDGSFTNFNSNSPNFSSGYTYKTPNGGNTLVVEGTYTVGTDPKVVHSGFTSFPDHTNNSAGTRNMMIVNGAPDKNTIIWTEKNLVVQANTQYIFSVWCTSASDASIANPAQLLFSINNVLQNQSPITPTSTIGQWINFTVIWDSKTATKATISIVNQNIVQSGNDFALDDIVFAPLCTKGYNVTYEKPAQPTIQSQ